MEVRSFENIIAELKKKQYRPIYFLTGEESYYIDKVSDYIQENVLDEAEKSFNLTVLYGKDSEALTVMNAAKRFPMMSSHQVVIVKEAQELKDIENLYHYAEQPLASTLLVLNYKNKPDKRKKVFKTLMNNSVYLESKKLYDNQVPGWITAFVASKNMAIDPKAAALLVEFLGSDLAKISNEINKLIISIADGEKRITPALIERNIGFSKDFNNYELQNALGRRDVVNANRIINYFAHNQKNHPVIPTIAVLYSFFSKVLIYYWIKDKSKDNLASELAVNPFFVKDYVAAARNYNANKVIEIIALLREYDMKSKGYKGTVIEPGELLKELIYKILH
ncbi:MAG: DNA polymerase III subunit delta [Bacteroidales bacterium]